MRQSGLTEVASQVTFALSRTMRTGDLEELRTDLLYLDAIFAAIGPMHPAQHELRRWEYGLLFRSLREVYGSEEGIRGCFAIDFACGVGEGGAIMLSQGVQRVRLTEIWTHGDWSDWLIDHMRKAQHIYGGAWELCKHDMEKMPEPEWPKYQVALCISSLEHVHDWRAAVDNMARVVEPGGMVFLTMDFAQDGAWDHYQYKELRTRIYDANKMKYLAEMLAARGFVHPMEPDWDVYETMVHDYTFSSLVMVKEKERRPVK